MQQFRRLHLHLRGSQRLRHAVVQFARQPLPFMQHGQRPLLFQDLRPRPLLLRHIAQHEQVADEQPTKVPELGDSHRVPVLLGSRTQADLSGLSSGHR